MSLLGKLMDTMRLNPDEEEDDYYLDDDFEEEAPRKGLFSNCLLYTSPSPRD